MPLLHVKDMAKGLTFPVGTSQAEPDSNVPVGTGQIDWPAVFKAAKASGGEIYYIEDESTKPWEQIPQSLPLERDRKWPGAAVVLTPAPRISFAGAKQPA